MTLERPGAPLRLGEIELGRPGPGQVLIDVEACGVCRADLHVVDGELPDPTLPIIPGHEAIGRVVELGSGVTQFQIGDRVGVMRVERYPLAEANRALDRLRGGAVSGAAVQLCG